MNYKNITLATLLFSVFGYGAAPRPAFTQGTSGGIVIDATRIGIEEAGRNINLLINKGNFESARRAIDTLNTMPEGKATAATLGRRLAMHKRKAFGSMNAHVATTESEEAVQDADQMAQAETGALNLLRQQLAAKQRESDDLQEKLKGVAGEREDALRQADDARFVVEQLEKESLLSQLVRLHEQLKRHDQDQPQGERVRSLSQLSLGELITILKEEK